MPRPPKAFPDTDNGWRDRYRHETGKDPDAILRPADVAKLINVKLDTIYQYRRFGNIPVPDVQEGGRKPHPGEVIVWKGRAASRRRADGSVVSYPVSNQRIPKPGELLHPHTVGWFAWRIHKWIAQRPGRGWHATGADRKYYADRPKAGPGEWVPPKATGRTVTEPPR